MQILTSLDFLEKGNQWPPPSQAPRRKRYAENKRLYNNRLTFDPRVYDKMVQVFNDNSFRIIPYGLLLNFYRKISLKTADLLFLEYPRYLSEDKAKNETIGKIAEESGLNGLGYQAAVDDSRYGDAVYIIRIIENKAVPQISQAQNWYPVADPEDLKTITAHVIAWAAFWKKDGDKELKKLVYQIHTVEKGKGYITTGEKEIEKGGKIGGNIVEEEKKPTGLDDFAVVPIQGVVTSDTLFGLDDYADVKPIIEELQIRFTQVSKVLDKHADPSMSGPAEALEYDEETGEYSMQVGGYYIQNSKESPPVQYITWDAQMDASFTEIKELLNMLSILSEMGAAIFKDQEGSGGEMSGRALRLLYTNALAKVSRLKNNFDTGYKKIIALTSQVGYKTPVEVSDVSIMWKDGLPDDAVELAEIGLKRVGGPTDTVVSQIMTQDGLTQDAAEKKAAAIQAQQAGANIPGLSTNVGFDDEDDRLDLDTPGNIEATKGLNGAQIKSAMAALTEFSSGTMSKFAAVELLVSVGIDREIADKMVAAQEGIKIETDK